MLAGCSTDKAEIRAALSAEPGKAPFRIPFADKVIGPIIRKLVINPVLRSSPLDVRIPPTLGPPTATPTTCSSG